MDKQRLFFNRNKQREKENVVFNANLTTRVNFQLKRSRKESLLCQHAEAFEFSKDGMLATIQVKKSFVDIVKKKKQRKETLKDFAIMKFPRKKTKVENTDRSNGPNKIK